MKKVFYTLVICVAFAACQSPKPKTDTGKTSEVAAVPVEANLRVEGMSCSGCEQTIAKGVGELAGIDSISANHLDSTAFVRFDASKTDLAQITKAIEDRGYHVVADEK